MTSDIHEAKEKIRKCLALAGSPNENEAKTALLTARRLMAQYKLSEADLEKRPSNTAVVMKDSNITYSRRRDPWMEILSRLIAEKHCCKFCYVTGYRSQTRQVRFVGFDDDLDMCIRAFEYAAYAIRTNIAAKKPAEPMSYALGFINGLAEAYANQDEECRETALATIAPPEVVDYFNSHTRPFRQKPNERLYVHDSSSYLAGHQDGKNHLTKKIEDLEYSMLEGGDGL